MNPVRSTIGRRPAALVVAILGLTACDPSNAPQPADRPSSASIAPTSVSSPADSPPASQDLDDTTARFLPDGKTIVYSRTIGEDSDIVSIPADGGALTIVADLSEYDLDPAISPDGTVVFDSSPDNYPQLFLMPRGGGDPQPLSGVADGWATYPTWSPGGDEIAYSCGRPSFEESDICVITVDGDLRGSLEPPSTSQELEPTWSPDGNAIVFSSDRSGDRDLYRVDMRTFKVSRLTTGGDDDSDPSYSPEGTTIAFTRSDGSTAQICLLDTKSLKTRCVIDGIQPSWSPDGRELAFYRRTPLGTRIFIAKSDGSGVRQIT